MMDPMDNKVHLLPPFRVRLPMEIESVQYVLGIGGGCASTGFQNATGFALIPNYTEAMLATTHGNSSKVGRACTTNILGIVASGDASIQAAKKNGRIRRVASVDREVSGVTPFFGKLCIIVRGD